MKKFLCLLVALVLVGSIALAEAIDLSSMTDDELLALKDQVNQTITDRGLTDEFYLTTGVYICGTAIKPGVYRLTVQPGAGYFRIGIGIDAENASNNTGTLFMDEERFDEDAEPKVYTFSLSEGNILLIRTDHDVKLEKTEMIG